MERRGTHFWNEGKPTPFTWYVAQGFNTVEINASFYRYPYSSWIKTWQAAPEGFTFSIKVHRSITHLARLGSKALQSWERFAEPFAPIKNRIDFWLFQMPPSFKYDSDSMNRLKGFFGSVKLGNSAVTEFRHPSWWDHVKEVENLGIVFSSVSAPKLPRDIISTNNTVYLRLHGAEEWYRDVYSKEELDKILLAVKKLKAGRNAIYLNNDEGMLENALYLQKKTISKSRS